LLDRVSDQARAQSVKVLHLEVRQNNPAMALYRAAGFIQAGIRHGYYRGRSGKVFDALTFRCDLNHN
jgi:[ribosomal protein S18]-alanine N-acetyltransferase